MLLDHDLLREKIRKEIAFAGATARKYFGKVTPTLKSDRSYLTEADLRIEEFLRKRLSRIMPDSIFVGEEFGSSDSSAGAVAAHEWAWVVDPIDGTSSFVDRLPNYCVSIGLARRGKPHTGVILFPETGALYEASKGSGAFLNGSPIRVNKSKPGVNDVMYSYSKWHLRYNITFPGKVRNLGTTAGHLALVARGAGLASLGNGSVWDYMGGAAILIEAGGALRHVDGSTIDWPAAITNSGRRMAHVLAAPSSGWKTASQHVRPRGSE